MWTRYFGGHVFTVLPGLDENQLWGLRDDSAGQSNPEDPNQARNLQWKEGALVSKLLTDFHTCTLGNLLILSFHKLLRASETATLLPREP